MQSDATGSASRAGVAASDRATAEQRRQYDLTRQDQKPFQETGVAANKRLAYLLGLSTDSGAGGAGGSVNYDALRQQLAPQYTRQEKYTEQQQYPWSSDAGFYDVERTRDITDQAGLDAEIARRMQADATQSANSAQGDSNFGSLLKRFSESDLEADPVYQSGLQFGLDQGTGAINARATQMGGYDSGATLKALTRYANDYGSTKANESYNRFNTDQGNIYNRLAGVSGSGQTATNQVQAAGTNMANNVSNLAVNAGDARAAGVVGQANAWGGALKSGVGAYQNYQDNEYLKKLLSGGGSVYSDPNQYRSDQ